MIHSERERLLATALIVASACCFGSISILTVIGTARGASLAALMIGRYALAFLLLVAFLSRQPGGVQRPGPSSTIKLMTLYGGAQALVAVLSLASLVYIPAAMMSFLFYTFPAVVAIIAAASRMERLTPLRVVALLLSLTGIMVMVGTPWSMEASLKGVLLALSAGVVYGVYVIALTRLQKSIAPATAATYICAGAGLIFLVGGTATGQVSMRPDPGAVAVIAALAIFSTALAFIGFMRGLAVLGSVRTSIVSTIEPFWTAILGAVVLGQPLTASILGGGALIAGAVILLQLRQE